MRWPAAAGGRRQQQLLEEHETAVAACDSVRQFLATYGRSSSDSHSGLDTSAAAAGGTSSSSTAFPGPVKITGGTADTITDGCSSAATAKRTQSRTNLGCMVTATAVSICIPVPQPRLCAASGSTSGDKPCHPVSVAHSCCSK